MTNTVPVASLAGIKVLDLTRVLAGPWATQLMADFGADVIKIERPGTGDDTRAWGPPYAGPNGREQGLSAYFLSANRGKRSVTVDLGNPEGQAIVQKLAIESDVVIENFKVGALGQLGLDYQTLADRNPGLIYCSITGFGQTGPHKSRLGYDLLVQAMGGLMSLTGEPAGEPMKVGVALTDIMTGLYASSAILAALVERQRSGKGQYIDLALLDVQIATLANQASNYLASGQMPARRGNAHPSIVPYQAFSTRDGYIVIAVGNDGQFARFSVAIGAPELAANPCFATNPARVQNRDELLSVINAQLIQRTSAELLAAFDAADVPAGPINDLAAVFADPQVAARGLLVESQSGGTPVKLVGNPVNFSRTPVRYGRSPPGLGADTTEVLSERLAMSRADIERLQRLEIV